MEEMKQQLQVKSIFIYMTPVMMHNVQGRSRPHSFRINQNYKVTRKNLAAGRDCWWATILGHVTPQAYKTGLKQSDTMLKLPPDSPPNASLRTHKFEPPT